MPIHHGPSPLFTLVMAAGDLPAAGPRGLGKDPKGSEHVHWIKHLTWIRVLCRASVDRRCRAIRQPRKRDL